MSKQAGLQFLASALILGGPLAVFGGYLWLVAMVFRGRPLLGLLSVLFPPLVIGFACENWGAAKPAVLTWCLGLAATLAGVALIVHNVNVAKSRHAATRTPGFRPQWASASATSVR